MMQEYNTMKKLGYLIILISMGVVVSCSIPLDHPELFKPTVSEEASATPTLQDETADLSVSTKESPTLSLTPRPNTPTPLETITPSFTQKPTPTGLTAAQLEHRCLDTRPDPPAVGIYSGTIILIEYQTSTYLLDLATGDMRPLLGEDKENSFAETVSPDREWLAYKMLDPAQIVVISLMDGYTPFRIPWEENWFRLEGWLNNQNLLVSLDGGSAIVINPFSDEHSLFSQLPDYDGSPGGWYKQYNPQLTRVVYPRYPDINGNYIALFNLQTLETITTIQSYAGVGPYGVKPVWSPSGDEFIMSLFQKDRNQDDTNYWYTELYRISQDGEQHRITNLREHYTEYLFVSEYQWSPDESQVAFWLRFTWEGQSKVQLAVIDMETYQVTNYCIDDRWGTSRELVWSPDSRKIIVNARYNEEPAVLLLDLDRQIIHRISEIFRAKGWMVSSR
jgi:hypothetical protein